MAEPVYNSGVTIVFEAFSSTRYDTLAKLCGLADADHARGKMARLWKECTEAGTYVLPVEEVEAVLGEGAGPKLVTARLGQIVEGGIRLKGTEGRTDWKAEYQQRSSAGGQARARTAERGPDGAFLPRKATSTSSQSPAGLDVAGPATASDGPAQSSHLNPNPSLDQRSGYDAREGSGDGMPISVCVALAYKFLNEARQRIDPTSKPLPLMSERPLVDRLRATKPEQREHDLRHCLDVLVAKAEKSLSVNDLHMGYLGGPNAWPQLLAGTVNGVRGRDGPGGGLRRTGASAGHDALEILRRKKQGS